MRTLSKSKLMAFRQCPKRLWLEVHGPKPEFSAETERSFRIGKAVGEVARRLYDPRGKGALIDIETEGFERAFSRTQELLSSAAPIFEAGFRIRGALAFADILLPVRRRTGLTRWRMIEVKASGKLKEYYKDDIAIQAHVARQAGLDLAGVHLAHLDTSFVYQGDGDYEGLFTEHDLTEEALARGEEVAGWIEEAQAVCARRTAPKVATGPHCKTPYACGFRDLCRASEPQAEFPVDWLPGKWPKALENFVEENGTIDMRDVPDRLLNPQQRRVREHTIKGTTYFDAAGAKRDLAACTSPTYFLDFETIDFAVPRWEGARPYQQIPFQFSLHRLGRNGRLSHVAFLDLSGDDPSRALARALIEACGERGSVFVYNARFEKGCLANLAARLPRLKRDLMAIHDRIVDLLPIARERFYHPDQQGSWSIKSVLPAIAPDLDYEALDGVQDGAMAQEAYAEAIKPTTTPARKAEIERQLLAYCETDTLAMVRLFQFFRDGKRGD